MRGTGDQKDGSRSRVPHRGAARGLEVCFEACEKGDPTRKRRASKKQTAAEARSNKQKALVAAALALTMIIGSVILAQRSRQRIASEKQTKPADSSITTASHDTPSKEYIYAGATLIATEEPPPTGPAHGSSTIGLFRPSTNDFFLRNTNSVGAPASPLRTARLEISQLSATGTAMAL